ncbi:glycosyltransferase [Flavobacterium succinicans]|uniref:Chondroitin synthase n=1 Tax=Flavobacterium succinicans TaxID=29536 RepID=A0A199XUT9_9FLAO|nr:glycosyltransferase [Flavobacterium succinicans]OAZ05415.1 chondroitin synthase [Flavobacterium succinicans]
MMKLFKMINSNPLVSICIPTYNGGKFIKEALQSAVEQTYKNIEIIISDDNSNDETLIIIKDVLKDCTVPFYIYNHEPKGIGENWNHCVKKSKGTYIKFLFQDDVLAIDCVEKMINLIESDPKIGMVYCKRNIIYDANNRDHISWINNYAILHKSWFEFEVEEGITKGTTYLKNINLMKNPLNKIGEPTAVLIKKECFEKIGYFNIKLKQSLDFEYWYRLMKFYDIGFVNEKLIFFRLHPDQATFANRKSNLNEMESLRESLYRTIFWQLHPERRWKLFKTQSKIANLVRFFKRLLSKN